jgi:hypothetical protein
MADRYPLIFDPSDNKLKEVPSGDNLNLTGTGIVGVSSITCGGVTTGRQRFTVYNNTVITTNITLTTLNMNSVVLVNTSDTRTITLPLGSSIQIGDWVRIVDVGSSESNVGNAYKKNIIITPNLLDRIQGGTAGDTLIMDVDSQALTLMWCGSTYDWRIVN